MSSSPVALPITMALSMIFSARYMKIVRMFLLLAPNDFRMPIIFMRLSTTMSSPAINEKHATSVISMSITTMLVSSRSSHAK